MVGNADELIEVELSKGERFVLNRGLVEWGGPARCTRSMAKALGFKDADDLLTEGYRIAGDLEVGRPLTARDWTRALLATEVVFASDVLGSGVEWTDTTGLDDVETLQALRSLQRKLVGVVLRNGAWEHGVE